MKTVYELKKLPASELAKIINQGVADERQARQYELNKGYLKKHPDILGVPLNIQDSNREFALHYTLGGLQALLRIAILDLQDTEKALEAQIIENRK